MTNRFVWCDDPSDSAFGRIEDPTAAWALDHGSDFTLAMSEPARGPGDFEFVAAVTPPSAFVEQAAVPSHVAIHCAADVASLVPSRHGGLAPINVTPAPLRRASVAESASSCTEPSSYNLPDGLEPNDVVVIAVIDDAINFTIDRFRVLQLDGGVGSRVDYAWVQDGVHKAGSSVSFGREYLRDEIELAITNAVDEDHLLANLGLLDQTRSGPNPLAQRAGHGTHVADIAAGADPSDVKGPSRRLITVQIPTIVAYDLSGQQMPAFFVAAFEYVLERTRLIGAALERKVPLVISFSYGTAGGPHDGSHLIERAVPDLIAAHRAKPFGGPVKLVLPTGNLNLARGAASVVAGTDGPTDFRLNWLMPPDDATSTHLEVWLPYTGTDVRLEVTEPGGDPVLVAVSAGTPQVLLRSPECRKATIIARATYDVPLTWDHSGGKARIALAFAPTFPIPLERTPSPVGVWRVSVSATLAKGEIMEAWVQRDASHIGHNNRAQQSVLLDERYKRYDHRGSPVQYDPDDDVGVGIVRRSGSLSGIATGQNVIVVGAYTAGGSRARPSPYSASASPRQRSPDYAGLADRSPVLLGVLASGTRSGSRVAMSGTSVAVPAVVRLIAGALQGTSLESSQLVEHLDGIAAAELERLDFLGDRPRSGTGPLPLWQSVTFP